ncbi:MAG: hypothetical protein ACFB3T_02125 [Geminicoccaceae bacterium]
MTAELWLALAGLILVPTGLGALLGAWRIQPWPRGAVLGFLGGLIGACVFVLVAPLLVALVS